MNFKALTTKEVALIANDLQALVGAQLQDCLQTASELGLAFYHERETLWLWFDLNPIRPLVVRISGKAPKRKKLSRPLTLFLKARFTGRRLKSVQADESTGRVLKFSFHRSQTEEEQGVCEIEVRLFPHGQNVIARDGSRSVAESKPKDLPTPGVAQANKDHVSETSTEEKSRSWTEIESQWHAAQEPTRAKNQTSPSGEQTALKNVITPAERLKREWEKAISKKEKAIERMKEELAKKTSGTYAEVGEWLKTVAVIKGSMEEISERWKSYIDPEKSISWNIENCFHRAKENLRKADGTKARIAEVEAELQKLKEKGPAAVAKQNEAQKQAPNFLARADAKGRRHKVADDLEAYIGKSASDNLALLRRAQPFDYWLHLRDLPGSHAILRRTRGRLVTDAELTEAGRWVVEQSLGKRARDLSGERYDLLVVECRFVRPIKGDKLGRVNYTNDRVITLRF